MSAASKSLAAKVFQILLFCSLVRAPFAQRQPAARTTPASYDEIYDANGQPRPEYREAIEVFESLSAREKQRFLPESKKDLMNDNAILPLPRIFSSEEYETIIRPGAHQRGVTIMAFLRDLISGRRRFEKAGIIPKPVMERILTRYQAHEWIKHLTPDMLQSRYGPDIIRDPKGNFRVLEDNLGNVGGFGDLVAARQILLKHFPQYQELADRSPDPALFYKNLIERYKSRRKNPNDKIALVHYSPSLEADNEYVRVNNLLNDPSVEVISLNPWTGVHPNQNVKVVVNDDGVYLYRRRTVDGEKTRWRKGERVGYVIAEMEPMDIDPSNAHFAKYRIIEEARGLLGQKLFARERKELKELLRGDPQTGELDVDKLDKFCREGTHFKHKLDDEAGIPGLWDAAEKGLVGVSTTPMAGEIVGDKEFNLYMDALIKFYTGKEPILRGVPTESFQKFNAQGEPYTDTALIRKVFADFKRFVIKPVDGRGGDGIAIGPKVPAKEINVIRETVFANPGRYIVQQFTPVSVLNGYIVDERVLAEVGPEGTLSSDVPWGRSVPLDGDGKVNLSAHGLETVNFVVDCEKSFRK